MSIATMARGVSTAGAPRLPFDLTSLHEIFTGIQVPDPITFICGGEWLDRGNLYPRQATLIKVIFLREDLFTPYDYDVIEEWEEQFRISNGIEGLAPGVIFKMRLLRARGHRWFREVLLVMGRRAGKGHVTALCMLYVLWCYMAKGNPQEFYGVDKSKKLTTLVFAGKRDQAKANVFGDLQGIITDAPCFAPFISDNHTEKMSIFAPHDFVKIRKQAERGQRVDRDQATFVIQPRESTMMAGRGPTSMMLAFDEMAHVVATGANRSAEEVYCLDPMTKVLGSDLIWRPIKDLCVGDSLVSLDEYPTEGLQRKLREAQVVGIKHSRSHPVKITFEDGSSVVCSDNHRWFRVSKDCNNGRWVFAGIPPSRVGTRGELGNPTSLKAGDYIRHIVDPWEVDDTRDGGWLAGILDGEGWVSSPKTSAYKVGIAQNPGKVLDRVEELLKEHGFDFYRWKKHVARQSICEQVEVRGLAATLRLIGQFRPERLLDKSKGLWEGKAPRGYSKHKRIVSIDRMPEQDLIDIETTTGTFLAEGLVSHNTASKPSLDQFGKDAFIMEPSSPWQMMGQYYENWQHANEKDEDGDFVYPSMLSLQLASWDIYLDWERTNPELTPVPLRMLPEDFLGDLGEYDPTSPEHIVQPEFIPLRGAIQVYDDAMRLEERANPDTFNVERKARWAASLQAYLNETKVKKIFLPWEGRPERYGPPRLHRQQHGILVHTYKGHADPSKVNDKFGVALAHVEYDAEGRSHCVFDLLHHFDPADYEDHTVDYESVDEWLWDNVLKPFMPGEFTFDQYNSTSSIQRLAKRVRKERLAKRTEVFEKTTTALMDWNRWETFKASINMDLVHAYAVTDDIYATQGELELRFLESPRPGKVDHPSSGPVQSKDIADCMSECVDVLIGEQVNNFLQKELSNFRPGTGLEGGIDPFSASRVDAAGDYDTDRTLADMSGFGRARGRPEFTPSRNPSRRPQRRGGRS